MNRSPILTLTTDFGDEGPYVAAMKGILLGLAPEARLIDVSHRIAPQNVIEGAFMLANVIDSFPSGTVHLAVIDPGVGTDRRLLVIQIADQWLVLPDNGLATCVLQTHPVQQIRAITNEAIRRPVVSPTFHGRDILAPAAAHLLLGRDPAELGPIVDRPVRLSNFEARDDASGVIGEVVFRDTFGNLITNVRAERLRARAPLDCWSIRIANTRIEGLCRTYADRPPGSLIALTGSSGWVEIALVNGDASRHLATATGATAWFHHRPH